MQCLVDLRAFGFQRGGAPGQQQQQQQQQQQDDVEGRLEEESGLSQEGNYGEAASEEAEFSGGATRRWLKNQGASKDQDAPIKVRSHDRKGTFDDLGADDAAGGAPPPPPPPPAGPPPGEYGDEYGATEGQGQGQYDVYQVMLATSATP